MNKNYTEENAKRDYKLAYDRILSNHSYIERGSYDKPWAEGCLHQSLCTYFEMLGQCFSAMHEFAKAKGAYRNAVIIRKWLFDRYFAVRDWTPKDVDKEIANGAKDIFVIAPEYLSSTHWNALLLSHTFCKDETTVDFSRKFETVARRRWSFYWHISDGCYFGPIVASLLQGDLKKARDYADKKSPKILPVWRGISECLRAIADNDESAFPELLKNAYKNWVKYYSRHKGESDAACFIDGIGLFRLAETVFQKKITRDELNLPYELLDDSIPTEDPFSIPDYVLH